MTHRYQLLARGKAVKPNSLSAVHITSSCQLCPYLIYQNPRTLQYEKGFQVLVFLIWMNLAIMGQFYVRYCLWNLEHEYRAE